MFDASLVAVLGTEHIVPITNSKDLVKEGKVKNNGTVSPVIIHEFLTSNIMFIGLLLLNEQHSV